MVERCREKEIQRQAKSEKLGEKIRQKHVVKWRRDGGGRKTD